MTYEINNFTQIESVYGKFVVNRHCAFQAEALVKTGRTHIEPELEILLAIADTFTGEAVVVDAGANIGLVSIPLARALYARHGVVLAFEVQRMIYYALCAGAVLNDLENLITFPHGLGAEIQDLNISKLDYGAAQDFGSFSLLHQGAQRPEAIKIVTLDSLRLPRLDLLKIDVEGMELAVLAGGRQTLARARPWCWVEYWKVGAEAIARAFDGLDYECFTMDPMNMVCAPADKLARSGLAFDAPRV